MSSSSDSETSSGSPHRARIDDYGRPLAKPLYGAIGESGVLNRVRDFLPLLKQANASITEPRISLSTDQSTKSDILLPSKQYEPDISPRSESSYGVEIDVGCGVFDVTGEVDESALAKSGVEIVETKPVGTPPRSDQSLPLIEELDP